MQRPVPWMAAAFIAGILLVAPGGLPAIVAPGVLAVAGVMIGLQSAQGRRLRDTGLLVLFAVCGVLRWEAVDAGPLGDPLNRWIAGGAPRLVTIEGRVRNANLLPESGDYLQFVVDVDRVKNGPETITVTGRMLVRWSAPSEPVFPTDRIQIKGEPSGVISPVNWGIQSVEDTHRRRGVHSVLRAAGPIALVSHEPGPWYAPTRAAGHLRHELAARLAKAIPDSSLPFVYTVWLGHRAYTSNDEYDKFARSGTAHILAVSGIHASIFYATLAFMLSPIVRVQRVRSAIILVAVFAFALTAGSRVSTFRAAIMIAAYLAADFFDRERDPHTALGISAFVFMIWDPRTLFDAGFQLSFLSVASILLFADPMQNWLRWLPPWLRGSVATTLSVQLLPLPVASTLFHFIPRFALLSNLIVVPLLGVVLWLCVLTSVSAFTVPPLALLFGHAIDPVVRLIHGVAGWFSNLPFAVQPVLPPSLLAIAAFWSGLAILGFVQRLSMRVRVTSGVALLVLSVVLWRPLGVPPQILFLDVGHGDAAIIRTATGRVAVIDGGDLSEYSDMGTRVVVPSLAAIGATRVDYIVSSHGDSDHIGGLFAVIDRLPVGAVVVGPQRDLRPMESALIDVSEDKKIPVIRAKAGDRLRLDDESELVFLHPPQAWPASHSPNDTSLVAQLEWPGPTVLFAGDVEEAAEARLTGLEIRADVLKVPHHGSATSSAPRFLDSVAPRAAVVSRSADAGKSSMPEFVADRYLDRGITLWRTDEGGGIRLIVEEAEFRIERARDGRNYPAPRTPRMGISAGP